MFRKLLSLVSFLALALLLSCQGYFSTKTPIHLNPNMDFQPKVKAQTQLIRPPKGVVPFGRQAHITKAESRAEFLGQSALIYHGVRVSGDYLDAEEANELRLYTQNRVPDTNLPANSAYAELIPTTVDTSLISRGLTRYNIYCAVCHGATGVGNGPVVQRRAGIPQPTSFLDERIRNMTDGEIFNVITHGRRNMQGYALQIPASDRWAIISYIRTIQESAVGVNVSELSMEESFRLFLGQEREKEAEQAKQKALEALE